MTAPDRTHRVHSPAQCGSATRLRITLLLCLAAVGIQTAEPALAAGGRVVAWGRNDEGQCAVPSSATNIVGIAATAIQTLALREDGTLLAWGNSPPADAGNLVRIAGDNFHAAGVRSDGTVVVWSSFPSVATVPPETTNIVDVAVGNSHVLALRQDGRVIAWGENAWGQLNVPASATNVVAISGGASHWLAVRQDGKVVAWGLTPEPETIVPAGLADVTVIAAGGNHSVALTGYSGSSVHVAPPGATAGSWPGETRTTAC